MEVPSEWIELQNRLRMQISTHDNVNWTLPNEDGLGDQQDSTRELRLVGGVDISFMKDSNLAVASLVVMNIVANPFEVVYQSFKRVALDQPYIPGFLAFREVQYLQELVQELRSTCPTLMPDILLVDGNGVLHPRGCGLASHLGVIEGICTIGVGKTLAHVDHIDKNTTLSRNTLTDDHVMLKDVHDNLIAAAFYANSAIRNPVYISVGNGLSLSTALRICRCCSTYRIPEPVRQADIKSREQIRIWEKELNLEKHI